MVTDVRFYFYQAYLSVIDSDSVPLGLNCVYVVRSRLLTRQAADTFHDLVDSYIRYRNPFRRFSKRVLLMFYCVACQPLPVRGVVTGHRPGGPTDTQV